MIFGILMPNGDLLFMGIVQGQIEMDDVLLGGEGEEGAEFEEEHLNQFGEETGFGGLLIRGAGRRGREWKTEERIGVSCCFV